MGPRNKHSSLITQRRPAQLTWVCGPLVTLLTCVLAGFGLRPLLLLSTSHGHQESQAVTETVYRCGLDRTICGMIPDVTTFSSLTWAPCVKLKKLTSPPSLLSRNKPNISCSY